MNVNVSKPGGVFRPVLVKREEIVEHAYQLTGNIYFDESKHSLTKVLQEERGKMAWVRVLFTDTKEEDFVRCDDIIMKPSSDLSDVQLPEDSRHWRERCDKNTKIKFDVKVWDGSHGINGSVLGQILTFHV